MRIETKSVAELLRADYNPRVELQEGDREYEKLKNSIDTFGYIVPIIWNERTGTVVGGHQRLTVLMDEGVQEVEVSVVDLDEEQEKQLNIALNKIEGKWDNVALRELLNELDAENLAEETGFERYELDFMNRQIEELIDEGVIAAEQEGIPETFNLTLTFDKTYKDTIDDYIRANGKDGIIDVIIKKAEGDI